MERRIAKTSKGLTHKGKVNRLSFSLRLEEGERMGDGVRGGVPVHGVEHFNGDENGQGHGGGFLGKQSCEHETADFGKVACTRAIVHL